MKRKVKMGKGKISRCNRDNEVMTYRMDMEEAFEEWFQARRKKTWMCTLNHSEKDRPVPREWSMGLRNILREGWMGATLWCRLCQREHEGPCISNGKFTEQ